MSANTRRGAWASVAATVLAICSVGKLLAQDASLDEELSRAKALYAQQGPSAALPRYESLLSQYRQTGNRRGEAITLGLIGNCYKRLGNYSKALDLLSNALQLKRELGDRPEEGRTLSHLGLLFWEQGEYQKAIKEFEQSIAIARDLKDRQLEAASLNNLSLVYDEQGDYRRSLEQYQQALALHRSVGYEPGESDTLGNIGGVYLSLGHYSEAERYYRQALEISRRLQLKPSETQDLGNLAHCLLGKGQIQEAVELFGKAALLARDAGMSKEEADWYRGKASSLLRLGRFDEALANYEIARATYTKGGLKRELAEVSTDAGNAYLLLGDRLGAEKQFRRAIAESGAIGYLHGTIDNQLALAEEYRVAAEYGRAGKIAHSALANARRIDDSAGIAASLLLTSRILRDQHRPKAAYERCEEARGRAERDGMRLLEAETLELCGDLQTRFGEAAQGLTTLDKAKVLASESGDVDLLWQTEFHRGRTFEKLNRDEDALAAYEASIAAIESVRTGIRERNFRTGYLQDKQQVYLALVRLLLRLGRAEEAFAFSERLREYSYRTVRGGPFTVPASEQLTEAEARVRRLQERVESESGRPVAKQRSEALRIYSEELFTARKELSALLDSGGAANAAIRKVSAQEIREALPADGALVEYVVDQRQLSAFVLTRKALRFVRTNTSAGGLFAKVQLLRDLIAEKSDDRWEKPAASLHSLLIEPLERSGFLKGVRSIIVIPHGPLNYLPFAALVSRRQGKIRFFVEDCDIAQLPAATMLTSQRELPKSSAGVLALAPARSGLHFAAREAEDVASLFRPKGDLMLGANATETRFKAIAHEYEVIHLATHGFFNKANPIFSGLQLEADGTNDGRLEVREIFELTLNARLVTLSACETALGSGEFEEMPAGDEFIAMDRAFLEAGSDAVLATLWKVDDRSTLTFIDRLYRNAVKKSGPRSLAEAQRAMIQDPRYWQPRYWAAFVYWGRDSGPLQKSAEIRN